MCVWSQMLEKRWRDVVGVGCSPVLHLHDCVSQFSDGEIGLGVWTFPCFSEILLEKAILDAILSVFVL